MEVYQRAKEEVKKEIVGHIEVGSKIAHVVKGTNDIELDHAYHFHHNYYDYICRGITHEDDREDSIDAILRGSSYGCIIYVTCSIIIDKASQIDQRIQCPISQIKSLVEGITISDGNFVIDGGDGDVHSLVLGVI